MRFGWILLAVICACTPVKDLNRVGVNYTDKSLFTGEWYHQGIIVDKTFNQSGTFIGSQSELERVRFEITEKLLIAHRSYAKVPGAESSNPGQQTWVAAFRIESHFDIKRRYNDQNGIEDNVIVENTERPWAERQYMRVDWSTNLVSDSQFNDFVKTEALQTVTRNALGNDKEPFRVRITPKYFETTIDAVAKPSEAACRHIGEWNCMPSQVRIKYSFRKVEDSNQYESMDYPDSLPLVYGLNAKNQLCLKGDAGCQNLSELWLSTTTAGAEVCDPKRHNVDDCEPFRIPVFSRFGFFRTERTRYDRQQGYTASGRKQLINRWNIWKETQRADGSSIPMAEREPKPVIYYLNATFPNELFDETQRIADDWSSALVNAVAVAKGKPNTEIAAKYGKLFQIKRNDCNTEHVNAYAREHGLEEQLRTEGYENIDVGNLEKACAFVEWLSEKKDISPRFEWQEIGDIRYSFLNYTTKAEIAAPLGYGPSGTDPLTGEIIHANANVYGASIDTYASWAADIVQWLNGQLSNEDIMNGTHVRQQVASRRKLDEGISPAELAAFGSLIDQRIAQIPEEEYIKRIPLSSITQNLELMRDSGFEDQFLVTDEMARLFSSFDQARPSSWAQPMVPGFATKFGDHGQAPDKTALNSLEAKEKFFGEHSACFLEGTLEPAVAELAASMKGKSWDEVFFMVREKIFNATAEHEIGHTLGLRHNFEGSADPMNYFPNYWGVNTGDERMSQGTNRKSELQYSSIMDYHQRFNGGFARIGLYDRAAIKFGYANSIEIFDEGKTEFVPHAWFDNLENFSYKDLPLLFSGDNVTERFGKHYEEVRARFRRGEDDARIDVKSLGFPSRPENLYKRKDISFQQYIRGLATRLLGIESAVGAAYEVPYKYCSDTYATGASLTCNRFDMGATAEEIVDNAIQMYDGYYLFNAYRGDKIDISPGSYMARLYSRTYQPMLTAFRYMYVYRKTSYKIWPRMQEWTAATYKGLNFFAKVLQTVEPGRYCKANNIYVPQTEGADCPESIDIGLPDGKYYNTTWSDAFFFKPNNIGHMYDKLLAMRALTDSSAFFTRDLSTSFNRGAFSIGYYRVFAPELIQLFSAIMTQNNYDFAPEVAVENGKARVAYRPLVGADVNALASSIRITPSSSPVMRNYAVLFPMIFYTSTVDRQLDYAKRARISLVGSRNDPSIDASIQQALFVDPYTQKQYRGVSIESDKLSPGYQLIKDAESFVADAKDGKPEGAWRKAKNDVTKLQAASAKREDVEQAQKDLRFYDAKLREKVQLIEMVKRLGDVLEFGN